jgi:hypothetical protein
MRTDDRGATLLIVLIIITVVALGAGVLLSAADTNVRTTVALRDQAASAYAVDGAGQVAVNQLRNDTFGSANCASHEPETLSNFFPASGTAPSASVTVDCNPDLSSGAGGDPTQSNTSPGSALLALDRNQGEDGIYVNVNAGPVKVRGGVFSNSRITAPSGLTNIWPSPASTGTGKTYNVARGLCDPTMVTVANPAYGSTTCNIGTVAADPRGEDPGTLTPHGASYDSPPAPTGNASIAATCTGGKYREVSPGLFAGATALAALNSLDGCSKGVVWFKPGVYYFDFDGTWAVPNLFIIGGTPTVPLTSTPAISDMPTACVTPDSAAATTSSGVEFVFGGNAKLNVNNSGSPGTQMTICASKTSKAQGGGPPIAVYGLKTALSGAYPVRQETLCPPTDPTCALINTGNSPKSTLTIQGTTYAPRAFIVIVLNNNTKKVFYWGLIAYAISFSGTGSADLSNALVDVPDVANDPTPNPSYLYLNVYVCPGSATCDTSGQVRLRAKVKVNLDGTVQVLSWSTLR